MAETGDARAGSGVAFLDVAMTEVVVDSLGPGRRAVWVQGCPLHCAGCVAPEWIPFRDSRDVDPVDLAHRLLDDPGVGGLTFSSGEPMSQAAGLARVATEARRLRQVSVVCFTGHRLESLRSKPDPGVAALLAEVDVLIDGPYVSALNDGRGLRGSSNQRVQFLIDRLVGVPPPGVLDVFDRVVAWADRGTGEMYRGTDGGFR